MIQLDTNVLIALPHLIQNKHEFVRRIEKGEPASACAAVWYEYLIGPLDAGEQHLALQFIRSDVFALDKDDAVAAADLFNLSGRKRGVKTDALIAAAAIRREAELFTLNVKDFLPFVKHGLQLFR